MSKFLKNRYYGDETRWFFGTVINRFDPDGLGRLQIRIHGIHSNNQADIPTSALPWANVLLSSDHGGTSGLASVPRILPGAVVFGFFADGKDSQIPIVVGSLPKVDVPTALQQQLVTEAGANPPNNEYNNSSDAANDTERPEGGTVGPATTQRRRLEGMKFFIDRGFTPEQAAGIMGNLDYESSGLNTTIKAAGSEQSYGIAQWNKRAQRFGALQAYAASQNRDWAEYIVQLEFVMQELEGKTTYKEYMRANTLLKKCTSFYGGQVAHNATWIFMNKYERPLNNSSLYRRQEQAKVAYDVYFNNYETSAGAG